MKRFLHGVALLLLVMVTTAVDAVPPVTPVYRITIGAKSVAIPMPPGTKMTHDGGATGASTYENLLMDPQKRPALRVVAKVGASGQKVPRDEKAMGMELLTLVEAMRMGIPPKAVRYQMISGRNPNFDVLYGGMYHNRSKEGHLFVVAPALLVTRDRDVIVRLALVGEVLTPNAGDADLQRARHYLDETERNMLGLARAK